MCERFGFAPGSSQTQITTIHRKLGFSKLSGDASADEVDKILRGTRSVRFEEIVGAMRSKYPDHGNLTTLLFSARAAVKAQASEAGITYDRHQGDPGPKA